VPISGSYSIKLNAIWLQEHVVVMYECVGEVKRAVMESRDLVSVSRPVSTPVFWSLGLGLEGLRSRLGFEGFRSRSRALRLETLHRLFFMKFCKKDFLKKRF